MKSKLYCSFVTWILAAGLMVGLAACQKDSTPPSSGPTTRDAAPDLSTNAAAATRPEFQKLIGKWLRPDGGYVLELQSVSTDGKLEAGYFNPGPIHVSKAVAIRDGTTTKVFVELQDVNYPGCTYSLTYDDKTDQLFGQYFQAAIQQTYDVAFGRLKE